MSNTRGGGSISRRGRLTPVAINGAEVSHLLNSHDERLTTPSAVHSEKVIRNLTERVRPVALPVAFVISGL